jgi:hypothetical protein
MTDRRIERRAGGAVVWAGVGAYVWLAGGLCHDGTSPDEFVALLVVGAVLIVFACSIDWILRGPGQLDREDDR